MPKATFSDMLQYLRRTCAVHQARQLSDGELLKRFLDERDDAAFAVLVQRHGPLVFGLCRRVLGDSHAAEDAFQATFMVLVRRAASIPCTESLGNWLYTVALRVASKARAQTASRNNRERRLEPMPRAEPIDELTWQELRSVLDEEIGRLPDKYRAPIVLCYFEDKSQERSAQELGWAKGTLARRLARGRELLRQQLVRRGIALSAGALATALVEKAAGAPVGAMLTINTVKAAASVIAGKAVAAGCLSAQALALAEETMKGMLLAKAKLLVMVLVLSLSVGGAGLAAYSSLVEKPLPAQVEAPQAPAAKNDRGEKDRQGLPIGLDLYGDPLPEGALGRLGTTRFRPAGAFNVVFAPDGKTIASSGTLTSGVCLWDVATGRRLYRVDTNPRSAHGVAFSPDGKMLFNGGNLCLLEAATGKVVRRVQLSVETHDGCCVAFSPDGKIVAAGGYFGKGKQWGNAVFLWETATGKELGRLPERPGIQINTLAFSPDSKCLVVGIFGDTVRLWDVTTRLELRHFDHGKSVRSAATAPNGKWVASAGEESGIRLWEAETGKLLHLLEAGDKSISTVAFSKDGKLLASAGESGMVRLWDPESGKELRQWRAGRGALYGLAFSPDGQTFATVAGSGNNAIRMWDTRTGQEINPSAVHTSGIESLAFSADGKTLFSSAADHRVLDWALTTNRPRDGLFAGSFGPDLGGKARVTTVLSPDGTMLAQMANVSGGKWHLTIRLWDARTGKELRTWGWPAIGSGLKFSADGKLLAVGSYAVSEPPSGQGEWPVTKAGIRLFDAATGKEIMNLAAVRQDEPVGAFGLSPNGRLIASREQAGAIRLSDTAAGKKVQYWKTNAWYAGYPVFSPDSKFVAFADGDKVGIRAADTGKEVTQCRLGAVRRFIGEMAYSPSGRILAITESHAVRFSSYTALPEGDTHTACTIHLWDVYSGQEIRKIDVPPQSSVTALAFAPDGRTLASGGGDSTILLWDMTGRAKDSKAKPIDLSAEDLKALWSDLGGTAAKADSAIWMLARAPKQSAPFLGDRLRLVPVTADQIAKLVAELDSEKFAVRQQAAKTLEEFGDAAISPLRKSLDAKPTLEVRQRIEQILEKRDKEVPRTLRALETLEHIGTAEARQILQTLAKESPQPRIAEFANAAWARADKSRN